jgi:hypothetical protein
MEATGDVLQNITIGFSPTNPMQGGYICCSIAGEIGSPRGYEGWSFEPKEACEKPAGDPHPRFRLLPPSTLPLPPSPFRLPWRARSFRLHLYSPLRLCLPHSPL